MNSKSIQWRPRVSYNDCPTWQVVPSKNPKVNMGECRCGVRKHKWFRDLYWQEIYPKYLRHHLKTDEQEYVMQQIDNQ